MNDRLLIATLCGLGLLSTTGASLAYPLLAPLFADGGSNGLNSFLGLPPKLLLGIALMVNPVGLLIGSAVLGPLSDGFGRRRALLTTTIGAALGHVLTAAALVSESYLLFLGARFFTGLLEGNGAVMRAIVIERIPGPLRNHALSWLNGAFHLGWLVGPLLAGFSMGGGITLPFYVAAGALLLGSSCVAASLPATAVAPGTDSWWAVARRRHAFTLLGHLPLRTLFTVHFAYACGVASLYEFFPLWLVDVGGYDAREIALVNMGMCALMTSAALFAGRASEREGRRRAALYAAVAAAAILCLGFGNLVLGIMAIIAFGVPHAYYNAALQTWSADQFAHHGQGSVMALLSTTFCLANIVMALVGAVLTLIDTRVVLVLGGVLAAWAAFALRNWSLASAHPGMEGR
ncbi:MFS transporter [Massilia sp. KIM]|uniref:MFS transporter n=1 Tax=Massilia sp. KIM TaxID=1955422 RepID=UPI00098F6A7D|nr:MFS transporter [Massilia sp. KIM]OON63845.1 MFS transporter [Massilia sp. KIM]